MASIDFIKHELKCRGCSSTLKFAPGTKSLKCPACGTVTEIEAAPVTIEEIDLSEFLQDKLEHEEKQEIVTVTCRGCGATLSLKPNVSSDICPYCATSLVVKSGTTSTVLKPKLILPFKVTSDESQEHFRAWLKGLWFAPNNLKRLASGKVRFEGLYIPYWTFDSATATSYSGMRGDDYFDTETYTSWENGKSVTRTRTVRKTRWYPVSGQVARNFDDVLVVASESLPRQYSEALEPWDLQEIASFDERYLSGFRTEMYQVKVPEGWARGKDRMAYIIQGDICRDIGGDHQRITSQRTSHSNTTFKLILLPIWISSYRYNGKIYQFLVNGRTGEVQGERPYSKWKIAFAVMLALIAIAMFLATQSGHRY